jgi:hypothetical protein
VVTTADLVVMLRDTAGRPVTARSHVALSDGPDGRQVARADGRAGEASRFVFVVEHGEYWLQVTADGYSRYEAWVAVGVGAGIARGAGDDLVIVLGPADAEVEESGDEGSRITDRITAFALLRGYPANEPPPQGRQAALEQKARMLDPDVLNAGVTVREIGSPVAIVSFGDIGRWVRVDAPVTEWPALVAIGYHDGDLGWVDAASLVVVEFDAERRALAIVPGSVADGSHRVVRAPVRRPGIYGLIGMPAHAAVRATAELFHRFTAELLAEQQRGERALHERLCQVALCTPDLRKASGREQGVPIPPGRHTFDACTYCENLELLPGGLPEGELLDNPPAPPIPGGCNWTGLGPRNVNGRIRTLAAHPSQGGALYAGSANGGVWVTMNAGLSWTALMRDQAALEIGAIASHLTDPANPAGAVTIYAGTGEATWWPGYAGVGVLKSTDSGATWSATGTLPGAGNRGFSSFVIDPSSVTINPATTVVYASGPQGLYRTQDGGATWTLLLAGEINNVVLDPVAVGVIYAGVAYQGIQRYDPGTATWSPFTTGMSTPFPQLSLIDIARSAPHQMFAKLDETVYRYDAGASSWVSLGNHGGTTYGYWNNVLAIDPVNSGVVFAAGLYPERSADSGATWTVIGGLHSDQHAIAFDAANPLTVYAGNDGGVYRGVYPTPTSAGTWIKASNGLVLTQYNDVGVSPAGPTVLGGGAQDNGTSRTLGGLTWDFILGADGGFFVMDPDDPYIIYAESQSGGLDKSVNGGASFAGIGTGFPGGPWVTPIVIDPGSPAEPNRVLFAAGNDGRVYRTANSGGTWSPSSPALGGTPNAIAIAPASSAVIYAGSDSGQLWRSSDNGSTQANWANIAVGLAGSITLPGRAVTDVIVHPGDANTVFVAFGGFASVTPATPAHVARGVSTDGGTTWTWIDLTANLPDIPVNALAVRPGSPVTLFAGTDVGVFTSADGGLSWTPFGAGLPNVVISDLDLSPARDVLRAATYGRGMWQIHLDPPCLDVDLYVRDSVLDTGETFPSPSGVADPRTLGVDAFWWQSPDIKVDASPYYTVPVVFDGVDFDGETAEDVVRNDPGHPAPNRLYVQVHNRGPFVASNVKVKVLYANASAGLPALPGDFWASYPNDWTAASGWTTVDPTVPYQLVPQLLPATPAVLRWDWVVPPSANAHTCMLLVVSCDEDPVLRSDAVPDDHLLNVVVPMDKHVALRNLHVVTGSAPPGHRQPFGMLVDLHNPLRHAGLFDLRVDLTAVPGRSRVALVLPDVDLSGAVAVLAAKGIEIGDVTGPDWWQQYLGDRDDDQSDRDHDHGDRDDGGRGPWTYQIHLDDLDIDPCTGRRTVDVPRIPIGHGGLLTAGLVIVLPEDTAPGSSHYVTVTQWERSTLLGGSTFELRLPPREVAAS